MGKRDVGEEPRDQWTFGLAKYRDPPVRDRYSTHGKIRVHSSFISTTTPPRAAASSKPLPDDLLELSRRVTGMGRGDDFQERVLASGRQGSDPQ
jgi:hypothetical protein